MTDRFAFIARGIEIVGPTEAAVLERCRTNGVVVHGPFIPLEKLRAEIDRECDALVAVEFARRHALRKFADGVLPSPSAGSEGGTSSSPSDPTL